MRGTAIARRTRMDSTTVIKTGKVSRTMWFALPTAFAIRTLA